MEVDTKFWIEYRSGAKWIRHARPFQSWSGANNYGRRNYGTTDRFRIVPFNPTRVYQLGSW